MTPIDSLASLVGRILDHVESGDFARGFEEPIRRGSASGSVAVVEDSDEPGVHLLRVTLGLMRVPDDRTPAFYRHLLKLNHDLQGRAAFSVSTGNVVSLTAARPVMDLDASEVIDLVLWTSDQADRFDDVLLEEYGRRYEL